MKKTISIILALLLCISFVACSPSGQETQQDPTQQPESTEKTEAATKEAETEPEAIGKIFDEPYEITFLYGDAASWPYKEDWYAKTTIEEKTGAVLDVTLVDAGELSTRINMLMSSGELPDIISYIGMSQIRTYALQGPFVNIDENIDKLPNYKRWATANEDILDKYRVSDGTIYSLPNDGGGITNTRFWFYRKDVFDKYQLTAPETPEELRDVLRVIKENEPDSYPLTYREFLWPVQFGTHQGVYYDEDTDQFKYGQIDDEYKEVVEFLRGLYEEQLIPPDIYSMSAADWTDMMVQGRSFITYDYVGRVDGLIESGTQLNPEYELAYMPPLNGKFQFTPVQYDSMTISKVGRSDEEVDNLLKYMDWFYSDEAHELLAWGEEDVTYNVVNGERVFIDNNIRQAYGFFNRGWFGWSDSEAIKSTYSDVCVYGLDEQPKYEIAENPAAYIPLNDDEEEVRATVRTHIDKYASEEIANFIIGEKSMDQWDSFVDDIKSMDLDKLLDAYDSAYRRLGN